jgi:hypothetical protein
LALHWHQSRRHTLALCLSILALLTIVNLRGTREAGVLIVEAVSNGVTSFREPRAKTAQITLTIIIGILV